jgi:hypothetical protein
MNLGDSATLYFKDGRSLNGQIVFNKKECTGRIINLEGEYSVDFNLEELNSVHRS